MLADLVAQISEGIAVLDAQVASAAQELALQRLREAQEALSLLALERAAAGTPSEAVRLDPEPALVRRQELSADSRAPQRGRLFLRQALAAWELPDAVISAAVDVGSELVANAAQQTSSHLVLSAVLRTHELEISVWDDGDGRPRLQPYRAGISERGIGLHLVTHLSREWGWHDDPHGKWVWARFALPGRSAADT